MMLILDVATTLGFAAGIGLGLLMMILVAVIMIAAIVKTVRWMLR